MGTKEERRTPALRVGKRAAGATGRKYAIYAAQLRAALRAAGTGEPPEDRTAHLPAPGAALGKGRSPSRGGSGLTQPGPVVAQHRPTGARPGRELGLPLDIRQTAQLIGCSPWTVRQKLIPLGLPHVRFGASGKITFYRDQVIRWIECQQQGGHAQP